MQNLVVEGVGICRACTVPCELNKVCSIKLSADRGTE